MLTFDLSITSPIWLVCDSIIAGGTDVLIHIIRIVFVFVFSLFVVHISLPTTSRYPEVDRIGLVFS